MRHMYRHHGVLGCYKIKHMNINIEILLIILGALALIIFFILRNRKDREKVLPPNAIDDPVQENRRDADRKKSRL